MAKSEVCLVHHFSNCLIITSFESIANIEDSLYFTDYILCSEEILLWNLVANFLKPNSLGVAEELYITVVLSDGGTYVLARLTSLVVGR